MYLGLYCSDINRAGGTILCNILEPSDDDIMFSKFEMPKNKQQLQVCVHKLNIWSEKSPSPL